MQRTHVWRLIANRASARSGGLVRHPENQCLRECGAKIADFYVDETHGKKLTDNNMLKNVYSGASLQDPQALVAKRAGGDTDAYLFIFAAY